MLFDDLLIHKCDITFPGEKLVGYDKWNRPIYEKNEPEMVKCRYKSKKVYVVGASGSDVVNEMSIHLSPDTAIHPEMTVDNIRDEKNRPLTTAKVRVNDITMFYDDKTLHHYKVFLEGAE